MPGQTYMRRRSSRPVSAEESAAGLAAAADARANDAPLAQLRQALDRSSAMQAQRALQTSLNRHRAEQAEVDEAPVRRQPDDTGLPGQLKAGIEQLSGLAMDDVRVHYNSPQPATVQAHAYTQGADIHVAPGQERHLPHEAWHVVQQKQGRVKPTLQLKGVAINDDAGLEREADMMGAQAARLSGRREAPSTAVANERRLADTASVAASAIQRMAFVYNHVPEAPDIAAKMTEVVATIQHTVQTVAQHEPGTVTLTMIDKGGLSPAFSSRRGTNVALTLNRWYVKKASVGEIVGMLVHELGVHGMADVVLGYREFPDGSEKIDPGSRYSRDWEMNRKSATLNNPAVARTHTMAAFKGDNDRRQSDHVSVGKGMIGGYSRANTYTQTYLAAGDQIANNAHLAAPEIQRRLLDLTESFLFDVARIVATDDGKPWAMFSEAAAIADLMNFYRNQIVVQHAAGHAWLNGIAGATTAATIRSKLFGLIGKLLVSSNPSVQKGRAAVAGGLVALGAATLGGAALAPALALGAATGLAVWSASKLLGF